MKALRRLINRLRIRRALELGFRQTIAENRERERMERIHAKSQQAMLEAMNATFFGRQMLAGGGSGGMFSNMVFMSRDVDDDEDQTPEPPQQKAPSLPPGRQAIRPTTVSGPSMFGFSAEEAWSRPFPRHAHSAPLEDIHTWVPGRGLKRDPYMGILPHDPPIAMVCPACDLEQAPLTRGDRSCPYCGVNILIHGMTAFWWRPEGVWQSVPEWKP